MSTQGQTTQTNGEETTHAQRILGDVPDFSIAYRSGSIPLAFFFPRDI